MDNEQVPNSVHNTGISSDWELNSRFAFIKMAEHKNVKMGSFKSRELQTALSKYFFGDINL